MPPEEIAFAGMPHEEISVWIVETHALLRDALGLVLTTAGFKTHKEPSLAGLLAATQWPDVAVIGIDSADWVMQLLDELPAVTANCKTIAVACDHDAALHSRLIELGAVGIVTRGDSADVLVKAVRKVYVGEIWLDRTRTANVVTRLTRGRLEQDPEQRKVASLTPREREIVTLVAEGLRNAQIGERLFISEATVRNHLTSILDKMDLTDRFDLAVYAFKQGLVRCNPQSTMLLLPPKLPPASDPGRGKGRR